MDLLTGIVRYLLLAYASQTVAEIGERLIPQTLLSHASVRATLREWLSTATGVSLATAASADLLADLGLALNPPLIGILLTGLVVGQGGRYLDGWLAGLPTATKARVGKG